MNKETGHREIENQPPEDTLAQSLLAIARTLGIPAEEGKIKSFRAANGCIEERSLTKAAKALDLKAKLTKPGALAGQPVPSIAKMKSGTYLIVGRNNEQKVAVFDPGTGKPALWEMSDFQAQWEGTLYLIEKAFTWREMKRRFNWNWFKPVFVRYKKYFWEVFASSFFLQVFGIITPLFTQVVIDKVLPHRGVATLDILAIVLIVLGVFQTVLSILRTYIQTHTTNKVDVILGTRLFRHIADLPLRYFETRRVGDTLMRVAAMNSIRDFMTGSALTAVMDVVFSVVFLAVMFYYSPFLTWISLAAVPFFLLQNWIATPIYQKRLNAVWAAGAESNAFLVETVTGMHTIKSLAVEPQFNHRWEQLLSKYVKSTFDNAVFNVILGNTGSLIQRVSGFVLLWYGGHMVIRGEMTVGQLIAFQMLAGQAGAPLLRLVGMWQTFQQSILSAERLGDIITTAPESAYRQPQQQAVPANLQGTITFREVTFRYLPDAPHVLNGISLQIPAGTKVGIVGRSGSGKSTLTKLVQRLYLPDGGQIEMDGCNIAALDSGWLRRQIGVVLQENYLFNGTVRENIALARPSSSMEEVITAATIAGAHEFILELPEGYDTSVGERGAALSGGQRQRIAIARALLTNPKILIFDEATSALDYQSERIIMQNMSQITAGRTALLIAHRLSTVRRCDLIIVMDKGQIVEQGTHEQLLNEKGLYYHLYKLQQEV